MPVYLYVSPAATGKTTYVLNLVREASRGLSSTPRVVVPSLFQVRAWRRRLAEEGGAMGVRIHTFDHLYAECLATAGEVYTELSDPVQYRLIRRIVDDLKLVHYASIVRKPGFVHILAQMFAELKAGRVWPDELSEAIADLGDDPRLGELALVYSVYQTHLQERHWADRAGLGWIAVETLEQRAPQVARDWSFLIVDGFDNFTPVQLDILSSLADRVGQMIVTLTGSVDESERPLVHRRFDRTRRLLERKLGVAAAPLPEQASRRHPVLIHLQEGLFRSEANSTDGQAAVEFVEAPDRGAEVRAALRWLKQRLVQDSMSPSDVALLARSVTPYRPFIVETAREFGIPVRIADGFPLRGNPAIAALLDLLRLMLPRSEAESEFFLPRRMVLEAWRSPYLDWSASVGENGELIGIAAGDADALDAAARWGRVIGGLSQWEEVLRGLAKRGQETQAYEADEERGLPANVPVGAAAQELLNKFDLFVERLTPPEGQRSFRHFVSWLEALIGPDPEGQSGRFSVPEEPTSLRIVERARDSSEALADRDIAALGAFKDVLRGLVWAEEALGSLSTDFSGFLAEITAAVQAATYRPPSHPDSEEVLVADVLQARGLPFQAVAVLGLAEGEFPATLNEDPFLRDADRNQLAERFGLALELSAESSEAEYFYETISRPTKRLLLTRPRLADNGALWQPSPFWEEVRRLVGAEPERLTSESLPVPSLAASWPELMESLVAHPGFKQARAWAQKSQPPAMAALDSATRVVELRSTPLGDQELPGPYDGDLTSQAETFVRRFGPEHVWSSSRLEQYVTCGFFFFVASVLGLEPREEPTEGLDNRQLGNIYHRILLEAYQKVSAKDRTSLEELLAALPVAAERVLDEAPRREGFRETAWWAETRREIVDKVRRSLEALVEMNGDFVPSVFEVPFGLQDSPPLVVETHQGRFRLRGIIDRIDRGPDGAVRVIDYKTSAPWGFTRAAVTEGKKLQLPLYALAARDALRLGEPVEGFYWHVRHAEPSGFRLSRFEGGPRGAMKLVSDKAHEAVRAARSGLFVPRAPQGGCPSYCPAAAFCWRYEAGYGP